MTDYEFYLKCQEEGISNLKSKVDKARIYLIAKRNGITADEEECINLFNRGKDEYLQKEKKKEEQARQADIDEQEKEVAKQISEAVKISWLFGRDKPIYYCKKEIDKLKYNISQVENKIERNEKRTNDYLKMITEKEKNWAAWGGMAEGIAGSAAGLATAMHVQQENAQIRYRNDERQTVTTNFLAHLNVGLYEEKDYYENEIKSQERIIGPSPN